jgi:putative ABC transport system substrate-binding protein
LTGEEPRSANRIKDATLANAGSTRCTMRDKKLKTTGKKQKSDLNHLSCFMYRALFIIGLLLFLFANSSVYSGEKIVITAIKSRNIAPYNTALRGFRDYLNRQRIDAHIIEFSLEGEGKDELSNIHEEIKLKKPDLVLTLGTPATQIVQEMIKDIPIIFTMVLDPTGSKISPPGVSMDISPEIKLRNIKRVFLDAKRIGLIYSADSIRAYEEVSEVCGQLGFQLIGKKIDSRKEFPDAFENLWWQIDCFLMIPDSMIYFPESVEYLLTEGLRKKLPIIGLSSSYTKAGAVISFDCNYEDLGEQAAEIALNIITGKNPVNATFVRPKKIDLSLNMLAAQKLKIKIPPETIKAAKEVFGR